LPQPYAITINGVAGANTGIFQSQFGKMMPGWYVLEADAELISGTFAGAAVFIYSQMTGEGDTAFIIDLDVEPDINGSVAGAGSTGRIYRWRKLIQLTHATPNTGFPYIYVAAHWTSAGDVSAANSVKFHRAAVRPASEAEVEARQAKLDLVTANANIATNSSAIATESAARAATDTTISAKIDAPNQNLMVYPSGLGNLASANALGWTLLNFATYSGVCRQQDWAPRGGKEYYCEWASGFNSVGGAAQILYYDIPVGEGGAYTLSLHSTIPFNVTAQIYMQHLNAARDADTTVSSTGFTSLAATGRYSITSTGNSSTRWLRLWLYYPEQNVTGYAAHAFRQIKVEVGSTATIYSEEAVGISNTAAVITNAEAIVTTDGKLSASYALTVDGGGRIASMKLLSNGTTSDVKFTASTFSIYNGTTDEAPFVVEGGVVKAKKVQAATLSAISADLGTITAGQLNLTSGSYVVRHGAGFGASSDLVLWYGLSSTAIGSATKTNGVFALATDGKVYYGASELGAPVPQLSLDTVGLQVDLQTWPTDAQVNFTLTASGGKTPYTYAATKLSASGFAFSSSGLVSDDFEAVMTGTSGTTRNGSETWLFSVTDDDGTVVSTVGQISLTVFG
jgi:hypothetical protein